MLNTRSPVAEHAAGRLTGHSEATESQAAGREAVRAALRGRTVLASDVVILFTSAGYEIEELFRAAADEAAPAPVVGCTSTGGFTDETLVPRGCVAALLSGEESSYGICHVERDDDDVAESARYAAQTARNRAGDHHPHSVLLLIADGLTPDQREIARGVYEVTTAVIPFVGGVAADDLQWTRTCTFGEGRTLTNGILAVWINSPRPMGVSVDRGWRPVGKPMLVTRAEGTVVHELDGTPALDAYLAEQGDGLDRTEADFFLKIMHSPVGCPSARGRYDVRQLHAYLPEGGGINLNIGIAEQSILQVMSSDDDGLIDGAGEPPKRPSRHSSSHHACFSSSPAARASRCSASGSAMRSRPSAQGSRACQSAASTPSANSPAPPAPAACTTRVSRSWLCDDVRSRAAPSGFRHRR